MAETKHPPVLSPVDYDAWRRGYMPPSEHILIDELSFRGARVVSASTGPSLSYWLVMKGKPTRASLKAAQLALLQMEEDLDEPTPTTERMATE